MANVRLRDLNPAKFLYDIDVDGDASIGGKIGIGTGGSISDSLEVAGGAIRISNVASDKKIHFFRTGGNEFSFEHDTTSFYVYNRTTSKELFTILNGGNVGINTGSPGTNFVVTHAGTDGAECARFGSTTNGLVFGTDHSNNFGYIQGTDTNGSSYNGIGLRASANYEFTIKSNSYITLGGVSEIENTHVMIQGDAHGDTLKTYVCLYKSGGATNKKAWAVGASDLGQTGQSYFNVKSLNDDGTDSGTTFYIDDTGANCELKSKSGSNCALFATSPANDVNVVLRAKGGTSVSGGSDWYLYAGSGSDNDFRIYRSASSTSEASSPNLALRSTSSGTGAPGGVFVGTTDTSGGGITWNSKARMLKVQSDTSVGSGAAAGIVLYNADNGNHSKSWTMYTYGTGTSSRLAIQYGDETARYTRMDAYGTWAYRGGVQQTAFWDYNSTTNNGTTIKYLHLKTNIKKGDSTMFHIIFEGYTFNSNTGNERIINSACAGYMYSAAANDDSPGQTEITNSNGTNVIHIDSMYATSPGDGEYLVIVLKMPNYTQYYCGITARANMANPNGRGEIVEVLNESLTTSTAEVW